MTAIQRVFGGRVGAGAQVLAASIALALLSVASGGVGRLDQAAVWLVLGLFAMSLDLMWGYGGLLSFGQAAFFGLGAYAYTWLTTDKLGMNLHELGTAVGLFAGIALPALVALLLGYFLFYGRVVGAFFAIVTMAVSFLLQSLGLGWSRVFGGSMGISRIPSMSLAFIGVPVSTEGVLAGYVFVTVMAAGAAVLMRTMLSTSFGLAVDGVRDNEDRLVLLGFKTVQTKLVVFSVASGVAGLAGALYASHANFVSADLMGTLLSTEAVVWVAVGGRGSLIGAFVGALVVRAAGFWLSDVAVDFWLILLGGLFIATVLFGSGGLVGLARSIWERGTRLAARDR